MSLDWNIEKVTNYKDRCWVDVPAQSRRVEGGERRLADDTNALVWGALYLDLSGITSQNIDEWCFRIEFMRRVTIGWIEMFEKNNVTFYYPNRQAVEDHIGLKTNVQTMPRAKWMNKIKTRLAKEVEQTLEREIQQREKENKQ